MTTQKTEGRVNFAMKVIGNLMHDNHLFDRTCPNCKGMYSSYVTNTCPKCGSALTYITTNDGQNKPMAISEGTLAVCFGPKQEAKDRKATENRKQGLFELIRFKRFSFADDNGTLALPKDHHRMKKGAQVEVTIINHKPIYSGPFNTKKYGSTIECMLLIFDDQGYGDTVKVLRNSKAIAANMSVPVDANGHPLPVDVTNIKDEIAQMEQRIAAMKAQMAGTASPAAQTATQVSAQSEVEASATETMVQPSPEMMEAMDEPAFEDNVTTDTSADPFEGAS